MKERLKHGYDDVDDDDDDNNNSKT